ncbi:DAK2 domain-containing protein [Corynebacterium suicordis]|uniref:DAK2 domain-containing protein n=1 Tax=Corynebacterium suicordis DSM 45110 TaxID=1121369 RepID=A0ABR9ZIV3_9CORY|nr:DAK2 domain-containing protein [Corynebacterium suicordis]MBF4553370.1 DAK2 domain-containing protein [Corynebacterium suicordis DSM 45110]MDR6277655.1 DAK2 domain fusion protein YloV [Corynebacterium suicordis]
MSENLDGPLIAQWARRAAAGLRERQAEINRLNVFPIADSDTGSNMAYTMTAAVDSAESADEDDTQTLTTALASGAVRGARGNSGMVLSQVLRALADTASTGPVDGSAVARMLRLSVDFVKSSISSPVEGTILSVLRAAAEGAANGRESLQETVGNALHAAEAALERTPEQLDVLAKAGVVDAGGRGLVVILQSLYEVLGGAPAEDAVGDRGAGPADDAESADGAAGKGEENGHAGKNIGSGIELEVMFMFDATSDPFATDNLREYLHRVGNSVVFAAAQPEVHRVHVHSRVAGAVIEKAYELGKVSDLRLEVLPEQEISRTPIIALTPGGGAAEIFESVGAIALDVDTASDREIHELLTATGPGSAVVLTNGRDASRVLNRGVEISVINTASLVGGLAALAVHDADNDFDDDLEDMVDAVSAQRFQITTEAEMTSAIDALLEEGGELVTLLWSTPEVSEEAMENLRQHMAHNHPDVEFHDYPAEAMGTAGSAVEIGVE